MSRIYIDETFRILDRVSYAGHTIQLLRSEGAPVKYVVREVMLGTKQRGFRSLYEGKVTSLALHWFTVGRAIVNG